MVRLASALSLLAIFVFAGTSGAATPTSPKSLGAPTNTALWHLTSTGNYHLQIRIRFFRSVNGAHLPSTGGQLPSHLTCSAFPASDTVIPVLIDITNQTPGFPVNNLTVELETSFSSSYPIVAGQPAPVRPALNLSTFAGCFYDFSDTAYYSHFNVPEGAMIHTGLYAVYKKSHSKAQPTPKLGCLGIGEVTQMLPSGRDDFSRHQLLAAVSHSGYCPSPN